MQLEIKFKCHLLLVLKYLMETMSNFHLENCVLATLSKLCMTMEYSAIEWRLGCVNSLREEARTQPILYLLTEHEAELHFPRPEHGHAGRRTRNSS